MGDGPVGVEPLPAAPQAPLPPPGPEGMERQRSRDRDIGERWVQVGGVMGVVSEGVV